MEFGGTAAVCYFSVAWEFAGEQSLSASPACVVRRSFCDDGPAVGKGNYGPLFLRRPEIGDLLVDASRAGERRFERYELHAFVVMANHVHLLVTPQVASTEWLGPLKGFTANQANRLLAREGTFWQDESYDRLVRSSEEFGRIRKYIERNPVKAGLVEMAEKFRWSSANKEDAA